MMPGNSQGRAYIESSVDYLDFLKTDSLGTYQDYLTLVAGKLGIGTDPSYPFHVSKSRDNTFVTCLENLSATGQGLQILTSDASSGRNALSIFTGGLGGTYKVVVTNNGNVGIGTTTPTARLDVSGSTGYNQIRMRTSFTPAGTGDGQGNVGDMAWDDSYFYVKTSAGWKRALLSTF